MWREGVPERRPTVGLVSRKIGTRFRVEIQPPRRILLLNGADRSRPSAIIGEPDDPDEERTADGQEGRGGEEAPAGDER